jgi:hypothetical protein
MGKTNADTILRTNIHVLFAGKAAKGKPVTSTPTIAQPPRCNGNFGAVRAIVDQVHAYDPTLHESLSSSLLQLQTAAAIPPNPSAVVVLSAYNAVWDAINAAELEMLSDTEPNPAFCTAMQRCADELEIGVAARCAQAVSQLECEAHLATAAPPCGHLGALDKQACLWQATKALAKTDSFYQLWSKAS